MQWIQQFAAQALAANSWLGALDAFTQMGGGQLFLETNTRLLPAIKLYESVGFRHQPTTRRGTHYQRADVYMVWQPNASD